MTKYKRIVSLLLVAVMVLSLLPSIAMVTSAATGYDRGYGGGLGGTGSVVAHGLDLSYWQGSGVNFANIRNQGYSFVILRIGYSTVKDSCFEEYYANAKAAGLNVGGYLYSYAKTPSAALAEANFCLNAMRGKTFEYPIYFDFEDPSQLSLSAQSCQNICLTFMDRLANNGYLVGLYSGASRMKSLPLGTICARYEGWVAHYYDYTYTSLHARYSTSYGMLQYSDRQHVPGLGNVDANVAYKDYPNIVKTYGFNGYAPAKAEDPLANLPDGTYTLGARENRGYKVGIEAGSTADAAPAKLYLNDSSRGQKFVLKKDGDDSYTLRNVNSNLYLEVRYGGANGEYLATQCGYTGTDAQRWIIRSKGDGSYSLQNKQTGKFLDLRNGEIYHDNTIQTWVGDGTLAQQWYIDPVDTLPDGTYTVRSASNASFGWDIAGNSNDNDANLQLWSSEHKFVITHGSDGYYTIRALNSGRYLDVYCGLADMGTNIIQFDHTGGDNQKWLAIPNPNGTYSFVSKCNGLYIDLENGNVADGTNIRCWGGNNSDAQAWIMNPVATLPDGTYTVRCFANPAFGWDIEGASMENSANLWAYDTQYRFVITHDDSGYYTIKSLETGRVLDVCFGETSDGTNIVQYDSLGTDNQKWLVVPNTDGSYSFVSKCNGKYIDLVNNDANNGTNITCWSANGGDAQKWRLNPADLGIDGVYTVRSKENEKFGWDIQGASLDDFGNLWLWDNEYRFAIYREADGYYAIRSLDSGRYLDVSESGIEWGTNIQQYSGNGADAQKWLIVPHNDGSYSFVSKCNGLYMDVEAGIVESGTNIRCWGGNGSDAQKWTLKPMTSLIDGVYSVRSSVNTAFGWDIENASHENDANLQLWDSQHKFVFKHDADGYYTISLLGCDKVLDVYCGLKEDGTNIQQFEPNGADCQKWRVLPNADGTWSFISVCNGKYIDLVDGNAQHGMNIHCYSGNASKAQRWVLSLQGDIENSGSYIANAADPNYRVAIENGSSQNGANVVLEEANTRPSQQFSFLELTDGYYVITNAASGKQLDVEGGETAPGANIQQWGSTGTNQKWSIISNSDGTYSFVSACNNLYLTLYSLDDGGNVYCMPYDGSADQKWLLHLSNNTLEDGVYQFNSVADNTFQATVSDAALEDGTTLVLNEQSEADHQKYYIASLGQGYYSIQAKHSDKYLDAAEGVENTTITQQSKTSDDGQKWLIVKNMDGSYSAFARNGGKAMSITDVTNGSAIELRSYSGSNAQKWNIAHNHAYVDGVCADCGGRAPSEYNYSGRYYIAGMRKKESNYQYIKGILDGTRYDIEDSGVSELPIWIETPASDKVFVIEKNTDGTYRIYADVIADEAKYLGWTSGNSGMFVTRDKALNLTIDELEDGLYNIHFTAADAERYLSLNATVDNTYAAWYKSGQIKDIALIPVAGPHVHTPRYFEEQPASCAEGGIKAHWYCDDKTCPNYGTCYAEEALLTALTDEELMTPALEHTLVDGVVHAPTCTEDGYTEYLCVVCGATDIENIVPAIGHNMIAGAVIAPTCTEAGYTEYRCANGCGATDIGDIVEALGHTMVYSDIGHGTHTYSCSANCGLEEIMEEHLFVDGECICGAIESSEPTVEFVETLMPSMSIVVGSEMSVAFTVPNALVGEYESFYLVVEKDMVGAETKTVTFGYGEGQTALTPMPNATNPFLHNASFTGLTAKEMGDEIRATLYCVDAEGNIFYGPTQTDSVKDYLLRGLDLATSTPEKKTMYVDMLRYGAVAQTYFQYDTENLVDADLTEAHMAYATMETPEAVDNSKAEGDLGTLNTSVVLKARVTLTLSHLKPGANLANMKFIVKDALDGTVIKELPAYNLNPVMVAADFDDVGAKQMRRLITVTLYDGDTAITDTVTWSVESYVAKTRATSTDAGQIDLVNAMLTYGDSVAAYLTSIGQ